MIKSALKITALVVGVLVTVLFLALLVMVTRPAVLVGVSGSSLAHAVNGEDSPDCVKRPDGSWTCSTSRVTVNWMGCWTAKPAGRAPARTGCLNLDDLISFD
ncbi:MAG: hypothetical protein J0H98_10240 [Solirubrobacterales bacterium]|nr:hypothetical protein [Solirubrobacterales bacterium]